jgi:hypothetical protein
LLKKWLFAAQDIFSDNASVRSAEKSQIFSGASLPSRSSRKKYDSRAKPLPEFFSNLPVSCFRNTFHNFRLLPGAGGQPAGLAKGKIFYIYFLLFFRLDL